MNQHPIPSQVVPDVPTPLEFEPAAWLDGYVIRAFAGRLQVEAVISPEGRLISLAEAEGRFFDEADLALIEFFAEAMAEAKIDGPRVVDLIAALPEDCPAARLLTAMWDEHPENRPEPRIVSAPSAPEPEAAQAAPEAEANWGEFTISLPEPGSRALAADFGRFLADAREEREAAARRGAQGEP